MARAMLDVETQTLWDQLFALSRCFTVAMERLHRHMLEKDVLMADETRWPVLSVSGHSTKNWFDWVLVSEDAVLHSIRSPPRFATWSVRWDEVGRPASLD